MSYVNLNVDYLEVAKYKRLVVAPIAFLMSCKKPTSLNRLATICLVFFSSIGVTAQDDFVTDIASSRVKIDGTVVLIDEAPFFARMIQHNGEPFAFLKGMGFNTIQLSGPATEDQLKEATRLGIWLVCPPPSSIGIYTIGTRYDSVLAWSVGDRATQRNEQLIRQAVRDIREADKQRKRPIFVNAKSHWQTLSQLVDIPGMGFEPIGTNFRLQDYSEWIRSRITNYDKPLWIGIQTEMPVAIGRQVEILVGSKPAIPIEPQQIKSLLYEAITGGARGVRFLSKSPLNRNNPETQFRAQALTWILHHAEQLAPWVGGGLLQSQNSTQGSLEVHSIKLAGSDLVLVQRNTGFEQWACGDVSTSLVSLGNFTGNLGYRSYSVNELGRQLLPSQPANREQTLSIRAPYSTCVLLTQDPLLVQSINQPSEFDALALRTDLTRQGIALLNRFELQLPAIGQGFPFVGGARQQAENALQFAERMRTAGNQQVALEQLSIADTHLAGARRQLLEQNGLGPGSFVSSPLLSHFSLLPLHLALVQQLATSSWNHNALPGGDFESLEQITQAGWKNRRNESSGIATQVELTTDALVAGAYGLRLTATSGGQRAIQVQNPPLWIESADVAVRRGQLVRFHGFVNVPSPFVGSPDGLVIVDSIGGPEMATRIRLTSGWQEFTIYRLAPKDTKASLTFTMTGIGQALVDEVTIRTMDLENGAGQQAFSDTGTATK